MRTKSILKILLLVGLAASLSQCSGDNGDSDKVTVTTIPSKPVVINAPFSYYEPPLTVDSEPILVEVSAPWFLYKYSIFNGSGQQVTIQSITFNISYIDETGISVNYESSLDPVELDSYYIGTIPVGGTLAPNFVWVIDGMTKSKSGVYNVKAEAIGWFGTPTTPTKSFNTSFSFTASDD